MEATAIPGWAKEQATQAYRDLTAAKLPLDDDHIVSWLATHSPMETLGDVTDEAIEAFVDAVHEAHEAASTLAAAAT